MGVYEYRDGKWNKIEISGEGGGAENNDRTITLNDIEYIQYSCDGFSQSLGDYYSFFLKKKLQQMGFLNYWVLMTLLECYILQNPQ